MDALRQALAENENELATCLARRRILAVEREKLQLQIALCERVCDCKAMREQVKTLIQQQEEAEATAAEAAARAVVEAEAGEMTIDETVVDMLPDTING